MFSNVVTKEGIQLSVKLDGTQIAILAATFFGTFFFSFVLGSLVTNILFKK